MLIFILLFLIPIVSRIFLLPKYAAITGNYFQNLCSRRLPVNSSLSEFTNAMICGNPLQSQELISIFKETSLIHIVVVSGSHLILLSSLIDFSFLHVFQAKAYYCVRSLFLIFYAFFTGFQPPVVRSLIVQLLPIEKANWGKSMHLQFLASLICLSIFFNWITSVSLQMSWIAALGLQMSSLIKNLYLKANSNIVGEKILKQFLDSFCVQIAMIPFIYSFSFLGIASNFLITPIFGILALPICFLLYLIPSFIQYANPVFEKLITALNWYADFLSLPKYNFGKSTSIEKWCVLIVVQIFILQINKRMRAKA